MTGLTELKITLEGMGKAIGDNNLAVPTYQRAFAWEERHVRELLDDISNAIANNDQEYFLGSVVVIPGPNQRLEVVDGQQRLATTAICVAAVRDFLLTYPGESSQTAHENARDIERDYLLQRDRRTGQLSAKLRLNETDNDFFFQYVLLPPDQRTLPPEARRPSHRKIKLAADLIRQRVTLIAKANPDPTNCIQDWLDYFTKNVKVIWVSVPDYSNAFTIFETLNDRGVDLAVSDLLKNHLLRLAGDHPEAMERRWNEMVTTIESNTQDEIIVTFVRHLWSSMYGVVRERELYQEIKRRVSTKAAADEFSRKLLDGSYIYAAITNPNHELWSEYSISAKKAMQTLNDLGILQIRPLLLALLDSSAMQAKDIELALGFLVAVSVRLLVSGRAGTGRVEGIYTQQARRVREGQIKNAHDLARSMSGDVPSDSEFRIDFRSASVSKSSIARYYLRTLESVAEGGVGLEYIVNPDQMEVNLEHVLPKRPSDDWGIDEETIDEYVDRIGNLALLTQKLNSKIKNASFSIKRPIYLESRLALTKMIGEEYTIWTPQQIDDRQSKLADYAVRAWSLSP